MNDVNAKKYLELKFVVTVKIGSRGFFFVRRIFLDKFSSLKIASGIEVAPPITLAYTAFTAYTVAYLPTFNVLLLARG